MSAAAFEAASGTSSRRLYQFGWCVYDWANSGFVVLIPTLLIGPYLTTLARAAAGPSGTIYPLGISVAAGALYPYVVSLSALLQVLLLPLLGALADFTNATKRLMLVCAYIGAALSVGLALVPGEEYLGIAALFLLATVSFGASIVFYNALLPWVAQPNERNAISSFGFSLGYVGGGLLLAANVVVLSCASALGLSTTDTIRISLASAGLWWGVFSLLPAATIHTMALSGECRPIGGPCSSASPSCGAHWPRHAITHRRCCF
jgi:UMF1 family MFS transporter